MIPCKYVQRWQTAPCSARAECLESCRAGWVAAPVACDGCGRLTAGPFTSTIVDDGAEGVIFRFWCLTCAAELDPLEEPDRLRFINLHWLPPHLRGEG